VTVDDIFDDDIFGDAAPMPPAEVHEQYAVPRDNLEPEALAILDDEAIDLEMPKVDILADYPWAKGLTYKKACFVLAYAGDATDAANQIGVPANTCRRWLHDVKVRYAIRERLRYGVAPELIADRNERMSMWTQTFRDQTLPLSDRLKASELLGKAECDFSEKRVLAGDANQPVQILVDTGIDRAPNEPIDITPHEVIHE
jgi:hypothetical protein